MGGDSDIPPTTTDPGGKGARGGHGFLGITSPYEALWLCRCDARCHGDHPNNNLPELIFPTPAPAVSQEGAPSSLTKASQKGQGGSGQDVGCWGKVGWGARARGEDFGCGAQEEPWLTALHIPTTPLCRLEVGVRHAVSGGEGGT